MAMMLTRVNSEVDRAYENLSKSGKMFGAPGRSEYSDASSRLCGVWNLDRPVAAGTDVAKCINRII
jgi:hypothetical protein